MSNLKVKKRIMAPLPPQMTSDQFTLLVKEKGWTQEMLAQRWGLSGSREIRRIRDDIARHPHYRDAINNVPYITKITVK